MRCTKPTGNVITRWGPAMADDIVTRLREETCHMPECCWLFTDAADEIERLRGMAMTLIDELRQNGAYKAYTPEMLFQGFYNEARRG